MSETFRKKLVELGWLGGLGVLVGIIAISVIVNPPVSHPEVDSTGTISTSTNPQVKTAHEAPLDESNAFTKDESALNKSNKPVDSKKDFFTRLIEKISRPAEKNLPTPSPTPTSTPLQVAKVQQTPTAVPSSPAMTPKSTAVITATPTPIPTEESTPEPSPTPTEAPDTAPYVTIGTPLDDNSYGAYSTDSNHVAYAEITFQASAADDRDGVIAEPTKFLWENVDGSCTDLADVPHPCRTSVSGNGFVMDMAAPLCIEGGDGNGGGYDVSKTYHYRVTVRDSAGHESSENVSFTVVGSCTAS